MNEIDEIEKSLAKVKRISNALWIVFTLALVAVCVMGAILLVLTLKNGIEGEASNRFGQNLLFVCKIAFELCLTVFMLWIPRSIFRDISRGVSPLSRKQAKRLKVASLLYVAHAAFVTISSPAILNVAGMSGAAIGFSLGSVPPETTTRLIPINAGDIVLAIVLFCAALIVEYGSLLQKLSDDTL